VKPAGRRFRGRLCAGQGFDQGRLAGAVVPHQSENLASIDVKGHVIDGAQAAIALLELDNAHQRRRSDVSASLVHHGPVHLFGTG